MIPDLRTKSGAASLSVASNTILIALKVMPTTHGVELARAMLAIEKL